MELNRRNFFKVLGVTGVALATGSQLSAAPKKISDKEFSAILYDSTRCVGCQTCEGVCAEAHGLPKSTDNLTTGVLRKTDETRRTVINSYKTSKGEIFCKTQCMNCTQPACVAACLTQAMYKTKEGPVIWRGNKCMGCRYCMVSCPFDAPKFQFHSPNPKIEKCNQCYEKLQVGELPACVQNCPNEALMFGTRRDLIKEARKRIHDKPNDYYDEIYGETVAGGTDWLYISPVPFNEIGLKTNLQNKSYPELTKGFLYSVPTIFILWPTLLLGMREATKDNNSNTDNHE